MTQSFDEYRNTLNETQLLMSANCCRHAFEAGQQSRQAEIDELQKRIDEVLRFANDAHSDLNIGMLKMVEILRGKQDEMV